MLFASGSRKLFLINRVEGCVRIGIEEMSGGTIAIPKTDSDYYGEYRSIIEEEGRSYGMDEEHRDRDN